MEFLLKRIKDSSFKSNVSVFVLVQIRVLYVLNFNLSMIRTIYFSVPPFIRIRNQMIHVRSQSTATLECEVEAFPEPIVHWERGDGRRLKMSDKYRLDVYDKKDIYKVT